MKYTQEQWQAFARRLKDDGCPILDEHGYKISPTGLVIEKIPGTSFNQIFPLARGGTGYEIYLVLRNEAPRPIDVVGIQIRNPWGIPRVSLLPAPIKSSVQHPHYSFPDFGPSYDGSYVINPFFARRKSRLLPGAELEGVLVASSEEAIPANVPHLARTIATLVIFDSRGNEYSAQFKLPVIRDDVDALRRRVRVPTDLEEEIQEWSENVKCKMTLDPPRLAIGPAAHQEPNEQETKEILRRFWEDWAGASERHQARMALGCKIESDVDHAAEARINAVVDRD